MTFGEKLQGLRRQRGWSQEQLADRVGVSRQALSKWERGAAKPDIDYVLKLCDLFGLSADALLRDDQPLSGATAPPEGPPDQPDRRRAGRAARIAGAVLLGLGAAGHLVVYLLSTMVLVFIPPESVEVGRPDLVEESWVRAYGPFVAHYHLQALVALFWVLAAAGALILALGWWRRRRP